MSQEDLQKVFPEGKLMDVAPVDQNFFGIPYQEQFLWVEKKSLSPREASLVAALLPEKNLIKRQQSHQWYKILFEGGRLQAKNSKYRVLQIRLTDMDELADNQKLWQESLREFFPKFVDGFFLTDVEYLLIEEKNKTTFSLDELSGVFTTLDDDFSLKTTVFVGEFYEDKQDIAALFQEERKMFLEEVGQTHKQTIFHFADVALHYYTKEKLAKSKIANYFSQQLLNADESFIQLVEMMWRFSGNVSSVAKEMFTHRNTINYRVEKIAEQSGINLKNPDDLALMHLLTLNNR